MFDEPVESAQKEKLILISEIFGPTIQGEGSEVGKQTIFVRTAGCDYKCERCDSLHSVLPSLINQSAKKMTQEDIIDEVIELSFRSHCMHVTLSGGNPVLWDLTKLVDGLTSAGFTIGVETQGTYFRDWLNMSGVHVTVSPKGPGMGETFQHKVFDKFLKQLERRPTLKVVIFDQRDIEFLIDLLEMYPLLRLDCWVSTGNTLPPEPAKRNEESVDPNLDDYSNTVAEILQSTTQLVEEVTQDRRLQGVRILPQLHVLLWGNKRGV